MFSVALVCALAHVHARDSNETQRTTIQPPVTRTSTPRDRGNAFLDSSSETADKVVKQLDKKTT
jgi:hypothetical protein